MKAIDSISDQELVDTQSYYVAVLSQPGCFSSSQVNGATDEYQAAHPADSETNPYFYCWDSGNPAPHHFGHLMADDHLCTYGELRSAGRLK